MKILKSILNTSLAIAILLGSSSCTATAIAENPTQPKAAKDSIYNRLGGQAAIDAAVEIFYKRVLSDKRVNHFFEDVNMKKQRAKQKAFLAAAFGGPVPYKGKDMRKAHASLDLNESDFNAIAGHLLATLKQLKVDQKLIEEIMAVAGSTKDDVLNR